MDYQVLETPEGDKLRRDGRKISCIGHVCRNSDPVEVYELPDGKVLELQYVCGWLKKYFLVSDKATWEKMGRRPFHKVLTRSS